MTDKVNIAIDAMGGENSPKKVIEGINISLKSNQENFFFLYGQHDLIEKEIAKNKLVQENCKIINTKNIISDDESPLTAAKRGKEEAAVFFEHKDTFGERNYQRYEPYFKRQRDPVRGASGYAHRYVY